MAPAPVHEAQHLSLGITATASDLLFRLLLLPTLSQLSSRHLKNKPGQVTFWPRTIHWPPCHKPFPMPLAVLASNLIPYHTPPTLSSSHLGECVLHRIPGQYPTCQPPCRGAHSGLHSGLCSTIISSKRFLPGSVIANSTPPIT